MKTLIVDLCLPRKFRWKKFTDSPYEDTANVVFLSLFFIRGNSFHNYGYIFLYFFKSFHFIFYSSFRFVTIWNQTLPLLCCSYSFSVFVVFIISLFLWWVFGVISPLILQRYVYNTQLINQPVIHFEIYIYSCSTHPFYIHYEYTLPLMLIEAVQWCHEFSHASIMSCCISGHKHHQSTTTVRTEMQVPP